MEASILQLHGFVQMLSMKNRATAKSGFMKILTVTLNPAIDRMVTPTGTTIIPGGKGVNVSRALRTLGVASVTCVALAGENGIEHQECLSCEGLTPRAFPVPGSTRINTTRVDRSGRITRVMGTGPHWGAADVRRFKMAFKKMLRAMRIVVLSGSLPPGVPNTFYYDLILLAREAGVLTWLDTSGPALREAIKARPYFIKPNQQEAQDLLRISLRSRRGQKKALQSFLDYGIKNVLLTLGSKGLVMGRSRVMAYAHGPVVRGHGVGCGDAALAGALAAAIKESSVREQARRAAACGAASAQSGIPGGIHEQDIKKILSKIVLERL